MRASVYAWPLMGLLCALPALAAEADFESPPAAEAATLLPPSVPLPEGVRLADPVASDGLMRRFQLATRYGAFEGYGRTGLERRLRETAALETLAQRSDAGVVADAVGHTLVDSASGVVGAATHPIATIGGIPRGISHLFRGYRADARDLADRVAPGTDGARDPGSPGRAASVADAKAYAARYFGVSARERIWYRQLGVDPYTDNERLRRAVHHVARVDATTRFGLKFASLPALPYAGTIDRAMRAIYEESPAVLRERRHARLAALGLTPAEIHAFENRMILTPTRQATLDAASVALEGVEGRAALFRHALALESDHEAEVYVAGVALLAQLQMQAPFASVIAELRMPAAIRADGRITVAAPFDAVAWTEAVAGYEEALRAALPANGGGRDLWLAAAPSARAAGELEARGWTWHVAPDAAPLQREPRAP